MADSTTERPKPIVSQHSGFRLNWPPSQRLGRNLYLREQVYHQQPIATGINILHLPIVRQDPLIRRLEAAMDHKREKPTVIQTTNLAAQGFTTLLYHGDLMPAYAHVESYLILVKELGEPITRRGMTSEFLILREREARPKGSLEIDSLE